MSRRLLTTTNKATIWLNADGTVTKEYLDRERARAEYCNLRELEALVGRGRTLGRWHYRSVKVLGHDEAAARVHMEFVRGQLLPELLTNDRSLGRHMGTWLGLFHQISAVGEKGIRLYSDVSVHNFLIDAPRRTITALDPGLDFGRVGSREVDAMVGVSSLLNMAFRLLTRPRRLVRPFLDGYEAAATPLEMTGDRFDDAVTQVVERFRSKQARLSVPSKQFFALKLVWLERYLRVALPRFRSSLTTD